MSFTEDRMGRKSSHRLSRLGLLALSCLLLLIVGSGCKKKEEPIQVTARFTDPVSMASQPSSKCIACHTQVGPINNLATPVSAAAETGG
jgi:hypothetical protein